jgi:very-short-patch-repair endonuclease
MASYATAVDKSRGISGHSPFRVGWCRQRERMDAQPFLGTEALANGAVSVRSLQRRHDRIYRNVYMLKGEQLTAAARAEAAWLWAGREATAAGLSAAALHGAQWIGPHLPAELFRRNGKPAEGILIHRDELDDDEVGIKRGIPTTTPARTAFDLGRRVGRVTALIRVDALANATRLRAPSVAPLIERHHGVRGLVQLREVLDLMDGGSESPQETRTRLVLVDAGLPRPQTQIVVGRWRIDMGFEEFKVGVEYDGAQHWTDPRVRARDIEKYAELDHRGWLIIRVSADMLRYRPHVIVVRTCAALREAGAEWPVIGRVLRDRVA